MLPEDLEDVVEVHQKAFPEFFLTFLGKGFLTELYKGFIQSDASICKVAVSDKSIVGFVVGNLHPDVFFKKLYYKKGLRFLFLALGSMFRKPTLVIKKIFYALRYRGEKPEALENAALLSSIAVNPEIESKGVGSKMMEAFCDEAFQRGSDSVYLTTDEDSNDLTNRFYLKNGFHLEAVFTQTNSRKMNRYIKFSNEAPV